MKQLFLRLWYLFDRKDKISIWIFSLLTLLGTFFEILGFGIIIPFIMVVSKPDVVQENPYFKVVYDTISPGSINEFLAWMAGLIVITFFIKNVYLFFIQYYQFGFTTQINQKLTSRLFRSYLYSPYTFHLQRNSAQMLRNINIVLSIISGIVIPVISVFTDSLLIFIILIILLTVDPISALIVFGFIVLISVLYFLVLKQKLKVYGEKQKYHNEILLKQFNQGLGSIKESKILGREHYFDKIYSQHLFDLNKISKWQQSVNALPRFIIETAMVALVVFVMLIAIARGYALETIFLTLSFFAMASIRLMPSLNRINSSLSLIRFYIPSLDEVYEDLKLSESHRQPINPKGVPDLISYKNEIKMDQVWFSYDGVKTPALDDFSITIKKNSTVGLVGESGAGKTTTVDIILGLLEANHGGVYVDGVEIHERLASWQRMAGYIPQQIYLMDDTFTANIAFGIPDEEVDFQKVHRAVKLAQLESFINDLPSGFDTLIGELGVRLSGGQRQRIGIARALYNDPELLIMDEATAALDNETERAFMESIESLSGQRTLIIIAHRLTTVEKVDTIFFLSRGKLLASGSYTELSETCPEFWRMAGETHSSRT